MAKKQEFENDYRLPNKFKTFTDVAELNRVLNDFEYFMSNYQQIIDKAGNTVPFKLNAPQRRLAKFLLPLVAKKTRLDRRHNVVVLKCRQMGASVEIVALINYICAFVEGMNNMSIVHVFPIGDSGGKFYETKVKPIVKGVHPGIYPEIERTFTSSTSRVITYHTTQGVRRNNRYEIVSANASSIRGATANVALLDECLTGDVEILTDKGFKRFDKLDKTERVAQFDMESQSIEFVKPLKYIERDYNGDAVKWQRDGVEFISTALHDFVVGNRGNSGGKRAKWHKVKACNVITNGHYDFPTWGLGKAPHEDLTPLERLGIAVQADGSVVGERKRKGKNYVEMGWTHCRVSLKRQGKIRRLTRLLEEANIPYTCIPERDGTYRQFNFDLPYDNPKLLSSFLDVNCSYLRARQILNEVLHWDGYGLDRDTMKGDVYLPKNSYYSSIVKENRDFVAAIALQAGQQVSAGVQVDNRSNRYNDVYRLNINSRRNLSYRCFKKELTTYQGKVYCVQVPSGCIVVKTGRHVWVCGNCSDYAHPYDLEAALSPAIPDFGFSLVVFLSTFSDRRSSYFLEKIQTALNDQENWTLLFIPWYLMYPEVKQGIPIGELALTSYDKEVIIPALEKDNIPEEEWGDAILWYHRKEKEVKMMKQEYPTTVQEILELGANELAFEKETLDKQLPFITAGERCSVSTDIITGKPTITPTQDSPFCVFKKPIYGHKYLMAVDPITSASDSSDFFVATVFDTFNNEQVAILRGRGLQEEDWAVMCVAIAKWYNRCIICPESNVADGFRATAWNLGYYNWFYVNAAARKNRTPGIRTTVGNKETMVTRIQYLLRNQNIIIHDKVCLDELRTFERKVKKREDNANIVTYSAPKGKHDDTVMAIAMYVMTLDNQQLAGHREGKIVIAAG